MLLGRHKIATAQKAVVVIDEEVVETPKYSKSDISRMNVAGLRELATKLEIEDAKNTSGEKLKEAIIEKLGL